MSSTNRPTIRIRTDQLDVARRAAGLVSDAALAQAMGMHGATVGRTLSGKAQLGGAFIAGLLKAFPGLSFEDLFAVEQPEAIPA
ncbi:helix-turn-helix domain-containing protein [Pseudonocardia asaccharolytica]|uniref:HTH cro/C1-type domain-containing protein n=1 Tax=Pseudonocardia asaccharolytica DSM 44247 = NBRC 16224 TaxID=1123024 RepID=A0A511CYN0_9PSEU|nr:helix-turn-helix transcriptional regulator [Pseudonocardia asaccharolytica]GEL17651.1 hypothetical protein PA7_14880 [Pseudonocardia asaccharolytica DSM 44247 = NBRC 16224]